MKNVQTFEFCDTTSAIWCQRKKLLEMISDSAARLRESREKCSVFKISVTFYAPHSHDLAGI